MATIDYFFSLASPFTYLAGDRLEQIAARHGAAVNYRAADIQTVLAETGGQPVGKRHPSRQAYRLQELRRLSEWAGLPLNLHPAHWPVDAMPASLAVLAVGAAGGDAGAVARAFLAACWAEERDIADMATVHAVLAGLGHDPQALDLGAAEAEWDANTTLAIKQGVFGAPFYVVGEEKFWGQDRLEFLDRHLGSLST